MGSITPWPACSRNRRNVREADRGTEAEHRACKPWGQVLHSVVYPSRRMVRPQRQQGAPLASELAFTTAQQSPLALHSISPVCG